MCPEPPTCWRKPCFKIEALIRWKGKGKSHHTFFAPSITNLSLSVFFRTFTCLVYNHWRSSFLIHTALCSLMSLGHLLGGMWLCKTLGAIWPTEANVSRTLVECRSPLICWHRFCWLQLPSAAVRWGTPQLSMKQQFDGLPGWTRHFGSSAVKSCFVHWSLKSNV